MQTYICDIGPQGEAVSFTVFKREVIGIQGSYLAAVVTCLVRILVVHIVWDTDLGEDTWVDTRVLCTFVSDRLELVGEAVSDGILANLYGERWREILSSQHTEYVDIPYAVPM